MPQDAPAQALRPATAEDRPFVEALTERSYRDLVIRQFGTWEPEAQRANFERKWRTGRYEIILVGGRPAGAFMVEDHADHHFLADLQIEASRQGSGFGTRILGQLIARAAARGLPLRLRVLHLNRARALYERLGFRQYGKSETHFLMEKRPDAH